MRAVRIYVYGGSETLNYELDVPEPTMGPDMVLIESVATSVNPIDWKIRSSARQQDFPLDLPAILSKDVSGVVRAVGSDIRTFKPGDRVITMADATYAQYVAVPGALVTHLPDGGTGYAGNVAGEYSRAADIIALISLRLTICRKKSATY